MNSVLSVSFLPVGFVSGAERRGGGARGQQRVQLRPPGRLRLRAAGRRPAEAEEREERQSPSLRLHVPLQAQRMGEEPVRAGSVASVKDDVR